MALGDITRDGFLDAVVSNYGQPDRTWWNDGSGNFIQSADSLGNSNSTGVALGDLKARVVFTRDGSMLMMGHADGSVRKYALENASSKELWRADRSISAIAMRTDVVPMSITATGFTAAGVSSLAFSNGFLDMTFTPND